MSFVVLEGIPALVLVGGVVGLALTAGGIALFVQRWRFAAASTRAEGSVVEVVSEYHDTTDGEGRPSKYVEYHPVVEFKGADGSQRRMRTRTGSNPAAAAVGDKVTVLCNRNDPQLMEIDSAMQRWLIPGVLLALGILVLGFVVAA